MNWGSWEDFWAMGGYGLYVWGSFGMAAVIVAVEVWQLRARRLAAVAEVVREVARSRGAA